MREDMLKNAPVLSQACNLSDYGIKNETVNKLFDDIVHWLCGKDLVWNQTHYINAYKGPNNRMVIEMMFFHYNGPPEREIGGGGERNYCRLYLYDDRVTVNFNGDNSEEFCGIAFKYSTKWAETNRGLLKFISGFLNTHLSGLFHSDPSKFRGDDDLVEASKSAIAIADGVLHNQIIS